MLPSIDGILAVADDVFPIDEADAQAAKSVVLGSPRLSARDAIHVAVMRRRGVSRILTFDTGFDGLPGVTRVT